MSTNFYVRLLEETKQVARELNAKFGLPEDHPIGHRVMGHLTFMPDDLPRDATSYDDYLQKVLALASHAMRLRLDPPSPIIISDAAWSRKRRRAEEQALFLRTLREAEFRYDDKK